MPQHKKPKFNIGDVVQESCREEMRVIAGIKNKPYLITELRYKYKLAGRVLTVKEKNLRLVCRWEDRQDIKEYMNELQALCDDGSTR